MIFGVRVFRHDVRNAHPIKSDLVEIAEQWQKRGRKMEENWKDQYDQLLCENSLQASFAASDLKNNHLPKKLYRYRPVTHDNVELRIDEIENGTVYLSHPKDLNDKFEGRTHLSSRDPAKYHKKEMFEEQFKNILPQDQFDRIFQDPEWYPLLMEYSAYQDAPENPERVKREIEKVMQGELEYLNETVTNIARKMVRVASFTTDANNLNMWDRYASGHKGICLEYDMERLENVFFRNRLFPVFYKDSMPDMVGRMTRGEFSTFRFFDFIAMHKTKEWSNENEWRLICLPDTWYIHESDIPDEFWEQGKAITFMRPSKVILGMDIEYRYEKVLRCAAETYNIPVEKAMIDDYGMRGVSVKDV